MRLNQEGILCIQHQIPADAFASTTATAGLDGGEGVTFLDFLLIPEDHSDQ